MHWPSKGMCCTISKAEKINNDIEKAVKGMEGICRSGCWINGKLCIWYLHKCAACVHLYLPYLHIYNLDHVLSRGKIWRVGFSTGIELHQLLQSDGAYQMENSFSKTQAGRHTDSFLPPGHFYKPYMKGCKLSFCQHFWSCFDLLK